MEFKICRITPEMALQVRHPVLRDGQELKSAEFSIDHFPLTAHFGVKRDSKLVAISTIFPDLEDNPTEKWQLRGMATLPKFQSRGLGAILLRECEVHIQSQFGSALWCNAREGAVSFYLKNGFEIISDKFSIPEIGPHFKMEKKL